MIGRLISLSGGHVVNVALHDALTIGAAADNDICLVGPKVSPRHARVSRTGDRWQLEPLGGEVSLNGVAVRQPVLLSPFDVLTIGTDVNLVFRQETGQPSPAPPAPERTPPPPRTLVPAVPPASPPDVNTVLVDRNALLQAMGGMPPPFDETRASDETAFVPQVPIVPISLSESAPPEQPPLSPPVAPSRPPGGRVRISGSTGEWTLTDGVHVIGRSPECHVRLDSRQISREHAYLAVSPSGIFLETANDRNGTSVNGTPIKGRVQVAVGDWVGFAGIEFEIRVE